MDDFSQVVELLLNSDGEESLNLWTLISDKFGLTKEDYFRMTYQQKNEFHGLVEVVLIILASRDPNTYDQIMKDGDA